MVWLDWTRQGWRAIEAEPKHGEPLGPSRLIAEDFELPVGSKTHLLRDGSGAIVHGYIAIPAGVS